MPTASYKGTEFPYGFKVLEGQRERDLKTHKYPNLPGADVEDLGELAQRFTVQALLPEAAAAPSDFATLSDLFSEGTPGYLYLPGDGTYWCYFQKLQKSGREGAGGLLEIEMEFLEALGEDLTIERTRDELEDMEEVARVMLEIEEIVIEAPPVESTLLSVALGIYDQVLDFVVAGRQAVSDLTRQIEAIQDAVERPYNELVRLAAEVEQTANAAVSLYRSVIQYADLPYTLARRLKNTYNILTSVARRFMPPQVDRSGRVIGERLHGRTLTHRVVAGDTLQSVSLRYYGVGLLWECLAEANGISDGNALAVGDLIVIPDFGGKPPQKLEIKPGKARLGHATCDT